MGRIKLKKKESQKPNEEQKAEWRAHPDESFFGQNVEVGPNILRTERKE